jgi:hypothetical protein
MKHTGVVLHIGRCVRARVDHHVGAMQGRLAVGVVRAVAGWQLTLH